MKKKDVKKMVGIAILLAIVIVLQILSGVILKFGNFSITLCLVPIVIGGMIYGVQVGGILGFAFGLICIFNGLVGLDVGTNAMLSTMGGYTCFMTILLCILKGTLSGMAAAFGFKLLKKKNKLVATVFASILCPLVNTGVFAAGFPIFLLDALKEFAGGENIGVFLFTGMISFNFFIELGISIVLSPAVNRIETICNLNYLVPGE